jgi:hypothetical protein
LSQSATTDCLTIPSFLSWHEYEHQSAFDSSVPSGLVVVEIAHCPVASGISLGKLRVFPLQQNAPLVVIK